MIIRSLLLTHVQTAELPRQPVFDPVRSAGRYPNVTPIAL